MQCRLEKVNLKCTFSRVKIIGTLLCVLGALTMSLMQSISTPISMEKLTIPPPSLVMFDRDKIIGCLYLLVSILLLSSTVVLQVKFFLSHSIRSSNALCLFKIKFFLQKLVYVAGIYFRRIPRTYDIVCDNIIFGGCDYNGNSIN